MIYAYLPERLLPGNDDMSFDEFYELLAAAQYIRDLRIEDVRAGTGQALNDIFGGSE